MQPFEIDWLSIKPDESHRLASDHKIAICGALSIIFGFILVGINGEFEDLEIGLVVVGAVLLLLGAPMSLSSSYVMWFDSQNTFVVYFNTKMSNARQPSVRWLKNSHRLVSRQFIKIPSRYNPA